MIPWSLCKNWWFEAAFWQHQHTGFSINIIFRVSGFDLNILDRGFLLPSKQGFIIIRLKSSLPKYYARHCILVCLMVFNATFNNILVLLVEETGGSGENHRPVANHWQTYHIMLYTSPWSRFELTTSVVIGTDCIGSCKSNYHKITATTPLHNI